MRCTIDYGSICSGIEAASLAWECLDFKPRWFAEIEPFPSAVLAHRWPAVPNLGDMTKLAREVLLGSIVAPLILVGGTPCQAFSVAGMRAGLTDPRGALTIKFVELADAVDHVRPAGDECIVVWENVPGVLSDKGNAFGCFLSALVGESDALVPAGGKWTDAGCVYGPVRTAAWRVLDAQYFGLAQRRRRVFVVASARAGFDPAAVLFESEGVRRDTAPRRGEGQDVAGSITASLGRRGGTPDCGSTAGQLQPVSAYGGGRTSGPVDVAACLVAKGQKCDFEVETFCVHATQDPCVSDKAFALGCNSGQENAVLAFSCKDYGGDAGELSPTLRAMGHGGSHANAGGQVAVCVTGESIVTHAIQAGALRTNPASGPDGVGVQADHAYTLEARAEVQAVQTGAAVRRLTPRECERLQGFPDNHTLIPWRGKPAEECPDGPRYKAIGNSKAVPVVRWIGQRIQQQLER